MTRSPDRPPVGIPGWPSRTNSELLAYMKPRVKAMLNSPGRTSLLSLNRPWILTRHTMVACQACRLTGDRTIDEMVMNMSKAKLIKKDSPLQEQLLQKRKFRRQRGKKTTPTRSAFEITTEWLKAKTQETPSARESFAALFSEPDTQSA